MNLIDTIKNALSTVSGVSPYFGELPRDVSVPCIRYFPVGGQSAGHLGGEGELRNVRIQVDVYAASLVEAWKLAEAARRQLTARPLCGTLQTAPFNLHEQGMEGERVTFDISVWGSAT